jgi:hypothetical protein
MKRRFVFALLLLGTLSALAETRPEDLADAARVEQLLRAQGLAPSARPRHKQGMPAMRVSGTSKEPRFARATCGRDRRVVEGFSGKRFHYEVKDRGEFGGELRVREGKGPARILLSDNVMHLLPVDRQLYVFGGLSHIGASSGSVYIVEDYDSKPVAAHLSNLPEAPDVVVPAFQGRGFLVISNLTVTGVDFRGNLEPVMARRAVLPDPNSALAMSYADVLVGICGGVAWIHMPWRMQRPPDPDDEIPLVTYWLMPAT